MNTFSKHRLVSSSLVLLGASLLLPLPSLGRATPRCGGVWGGCETGTWILDDGPYLYLRE
jgi:hypothetical protein